MSDGECRDSGGKGYEPGVARRQHRASNAAVVASPRRFVLRADTSSLRALILGTLGLIGACGGESVGDGSSGAGGASGAGSVPASANCTGATEDLGGGFERCENGVVHRSVVGDCSSFGANLQPSTEQPSAGQSSTGQSPDEPTDTAEGGSGQGGFGQGGSGQGGFGQGGQAPACSSCCTRDSDCTAAPHGRCAPNPVGNPAYDVCTYGCVTDAECQAGEICRCNGSIGACTIASCRVDADCPGDLLCSEYDRNPGCNQHGFACQTPGDSCASQDQCESPARWCAIATGGSTRTCSTAVCSIGRPFLVGDTARLAPLEVRADWYTAPDAELPCAPPSRPLDAPLQRAVRAGWLQQALMEHASVAAFARFSLQLSSLGAPPDLLLGAAQAMLDEIGHARGCFELARRHSDTDVGPGPLPVADALEQNDLESVVLGAIAEGCIGETVAALEASELLLHAEDAAARALLERIATDEARHAELAWRFVSWALATAPEPLRARITSAFQSAVAPALTPEPDASVLGSSLDAELLAHGLASEPLRQSVRRRALLEIVAPCASTLLARGTRDDADDSRLATRLKGAGSASPPRPS